MKVQYILLIILAILIVVMVVLYFYGRRMQRRQADAQEKIEAAKQNVTMLIIDKKRMPIKDANLPQVVIDQVPKLMRRSKMPIVKCKIGPQITTMIADEKIYDLIPVKKEVKATVSGIYITDVKAAHGKLEAPPQKKTWRQRLLGWQNKAQNKLNETESTSTKSKKKK